MKQTEKASLVIRSKTGLQKGIKFGVCAGLCVALTLSGSAALAGFLEMPETTEVPDLEKKTLLKDLDVPNVRERDPDPEAGPRLNVTQFRIQGVVEYPELGITREKLNKLVEDIRFDLMEEGELLDSGYTLEEISEISDMVAEIEEETGDQHVGPLEVQRLVFLVREQRRKRGVTLGNIETVADTITRYYRERGFILAKAYIPQQKVRDGIVTLTLLLGELGEVAVQKNKIYKEKTLQRLFKPVMHKPVTSKSIEERIYYVNDLPGLSVQGYFEPGSQVGDTRLNLNVLNEERFGSSIRADNHGSESTGKNRLYLEGYWNNPLGYGDRLQLAVLSTFSPQNSDYGSLRYKMPIWGPRFTATIGASRNAFVPASSISGNDDDENQNGGGNVSETTVDSVSEVADLVFAFQGSRGRLKNTTYSLRVAQLESETSLNDNLPTTESSTNLELTYTFDVLQQKRSTLHQGSISIIAGESESSLFTGQDDKPETFRYLRASYTFLKFIKLPFFDSRARWIVKSSGQYSGESLSSINQFGITGPNAARSFSVEDYFADDGFYLGSDLTFDAPSFLKGSIAGEKLNRILKPYIFADVSYGTQYSDGNLGQEPVLSRATLGNIGFGLNVSFKGRFRANLSFATPMIFDPDLQSFYDATVSVEGGGAAGINRIPLEGADKSRVFFDMQYSF